MRQAVPCLMNRLICWYEQEAGRRTVANLLTRDEARGRENDRRDHCDREFPFWTELAGVAHEVLPRGKHTAARDRNMKRSDPQAASGRVAEIENAGRCGAASAAIAESRRI